MYCMSTYSENDVILRTMARYARFPLRYRCGKSNAAIDWNHACWKPVQISRPPTPIPAPFTWKYGRAWPGKRLTREHILPRCYGGTILIRVCRECNQKQGNSPVYPDFIRFIREHPALWREAKREACPMDTQAYGRFLNQVKHALQKSPKAKHLLA